MLHNYHDHVFTLTLVYCRPSHPLSFASLLTDTSPPPRHFEKEDRLRHHLNIERQDLGLSSLSALARHQRENLPRQCGFGCDGGRAEGTILSILFFPLFYPPPYRTVDAPERALIIHTLFRTFFPLGHGWCIIWPWCMHRHQESQLTFDGEIIRRYRV